MKLNRYILIIFSIAMLSPINYYSISSDEDFQHIVIIDDGQSNGEGAAPYWSLDSIYKVAHDRLYIWDSTQMVVYDTNNRKIGTYNENYSTHGIYPILMKILRDSIEKAHIYLLRTSKSSSQLCQNAALDHNVNTTDELHDKMISRITAAKQYFYIRNIKPKWKYIWLQGEGDQQSTACANEYYSNWSDKIDSILVVIPEIKIIPYLLSNDIDYVTQDTINNAFIRGLSNYENYDTVDNYRGRFEHLSVSDSVHYSNAGYTDMAFAIYPKILEP